MSKNKKNNMEIEVVLLNEPNYKLAVENLIKLANKTSIPKDKEINKKDIKTAS